MKAVQLREHGGPEVLEVVDKPLPEPAAHEVRVRALAIGVGSADTLIRNGTYRWMPPLPAVPGNELAGVIDKIGEAATPALIGRHVLGELARAAATRRLLCAVRVCACGRRLPAPARDRHP